MPRVPQKFTVTLSNALWSKAPEIRGLAGARERIRTSGLRLRRPSV